MKKSQKCIVWGIASVTAIFLGQAAFASVGLAFGAEQAVMTGVAGLIGGVKLLAGS